MKTEAFVENLNVNRGENGSAWGMGADGLPYFGEDQDYESPESPAANNKYEVTFTSARTGKTVTAADGMLYPSPDDVVVGENGAACVSGTLELKGLPKGAKVTWGTPDANRGDIAVNEETGLLHVYNDAVGTVTATLHKDDGTTENVATVVVKAISKPIDDFQIWYNGENVTGGTIAVTGSEVKNLEIRVHYTDAAEGEYTPVSYTRFRFAGTPSNVLYSNPGSACFYFKKAGEATIWISSRTNVDLADKSVKVTSTYVPATSISLGYNEDARRSICMAVIRLPRVLSSLTRLHRSWARSMRVTVQTTRHLGRYCGRRVHYKRRYWIYAVQGRQDDVRGDGQKPGRQRYLLGQARGYLRLPKPAEIGDDCKCSRVH